LGQPSPIIEAEMSNHHNQLLHLSSACKDLKLLLSMHSLFDEDAKDVYEQRNQVSRTCVGFQSTHPNSVEPESSETSASSACSHLTNGNNLHATSTIECLLDHQSLHVKCSRMSDNSGSSELTSDSPNLALRVADKRVQLNHSLDALNYSVAETASVFAKFKRDIITQQAKPSLEQSARLQMPSVDRLRTASEQATQLFICVTALESSTSALESLL
jgi:hypothetical protein